MSPLVNGEVSLESDDPKPVSRGPVEKHSEDTRGTRCRVFGHGGTSKLGVLEYEIHRSPV